MKILDIDLDYFVRYDYSRKSIYPDKRLPENEYADKVWSEEDVRAFFVKNLGLSKAKKVPGRIVTNHNEALFFWQELISADKLNTPFEVIHVDSHADLGLGTAASAYIIKTLLYFPVEERPLHSVITGEKRREGIGDYLLYAIAYRMISSLTYCGNPLIQCNDFRRIIIQNFKEVDVNVGGNPVNSSIQLFCTQLPRPNFIPKDMFDKIKIQNIINDKEKRLEPAVPFRIIPRIEDVQYDGDFDFAVLSQSPNYTPASADYIMNVFREYIEEI